MGANGAQAVRHHSWGNLNFSRTATGITKWFWVTIEGYLNYILPKFEDFIPTGLGYGADCVYFCLELPGWCLEKHINFLADLGIFFAFSYLDRKYLLFFQLRDNKFVWGIFLGILEKTSSTHTGTFLKRAVHQSIDVCIYGEKIYVYI